MDFSSIYNFIMIYWYVILPTIVIILYIAYSWANWEQTKFKWMCFGMKLPFIGKITSLSKSFSKKNNWFSSELMLCSDFYSYHDRYDKGTDFYKNCKSYLSKVDEIGRKPFPKILWIVVFGLVILESLGFAYVLAGYTLPGASENLQQKGAMGISLVLSVILVGFTHWSGFEIYKNSVIKKIRVMYRNNKDDRYKLERDTKVTLENDGRDDNAPAYTQMANRISANATYTPTWIISIITAIFIVVIAIGATYVRGQVLEQQLTDDVKINAETAYMPYPTDLVESQKEADTKVDEAIVDSERKGGWATFVVLAVLFIFIQLLGILFGYKWGFVGKESYIAYVTSSKFANEEEYKRYFSRKKDNIEKIAQKYLGKLQHKMSKLIEKNEHPDGDTKLLVQTAGERTFSAFLKLENDTKKNNQSINTYANENKVKIINCAKCGQQLEESSKFCKSCGASISKVPTCPKCGKTYDNGTKFCSNDGSKLELI